MKVVVGKVQDGAGHFINRMSQYPHIFEAATGEKLFPGTLNVKVAENVRVRRHFEILGKDIGEPEQDLWFEICRINGIWAYRVRPKNVRDGSGGHGDDVLEIACSLELRCNTITNGTEVRIEFFE